MGKTHMQNSGSAPVKRSKFRLMAGKAYYTLSRYALWYFGGFRFAHERNPKLLDYSYFSHETPLLRKLNNLDMQYQYNKIVNLKLAASRLDGILVRPGEVFSYWRLVGKPSAKKGYVPGMILHCGAYRMGVGGGLCQLSNLVYWMTLHTPLTVIERYRHSYDVFPDSNRTQPFGSGATCVYPYRDLMIRNDTDTVFQLHVNVGESHLEGQWLSDNPPEYRYEIIEKSHQIKGEYWGGFSRHNELYRGKYTVAGEFLGEEYVAENHAIMMYSPFLPGAGDRADEGFGKGADTTQQIR
ncbi:MAG TPA: VanW family protein [Clostridia bacterium]|nr:VanW family protein [Clostridia bacterium]